MKKKKNKKKYYSNNFIPDVIAFYAQQKNQEYYSQFQLEFVNEEQIHEAATQIFGKSYYIDFCDIK